MLPDVVITDYYKKNGLKKDPYNEFVKQILHPYYIFGLPWNVEEIKKINNICKIK